MLTALSIRNFALIEQLELEFGPGLSVFTGETGAGKSILFDALQLALGGRASAASVREGRCEVSAEFDLSHRPDLTQWLAAEELDLEEDLLLRRVLKAEGRSRAYINGVPVPVQKLRQLGDLLVEIHGQHEHQALTRGTEQLRLLDAYLNRPRDVASLAALFEDWKVAQSALEALRAQAALSPAELDLLRYQIDELGRHAVDAGELERLNEEQRRLAGMGDLIAAGGEALALVEGEADSTAGGAAAQLTAAIHHLERAVQVDPQLAEPLELLRSALIQTQEAGATLNRYQRSVELDPERLGRVEDQLAEIYQLARKHRVAPEDLKQQLSTLESRLADAVEFEQREQSLGEELGRLEDRYRKLAGALSKGRQAAADQLAAEVTAMMAQLGMQGGRFEIAVDHDPQRPFRRAGLDEVVYRVAANPGSELAPLGQVASGGELSRICLAIKVSLSESDRPVSMIFDEVDAGVGGATAQIVGQKLRAVAAATQVFCVTHLPQVAACAHRHFQVEKKQQKGATITTATPLNEVDRVAEVARMLGGLKITEQTRAHAEEMLREAAG